MSPAWLFVFPALALMIAIVGAIVVKINPTGE